MAIERKIKGIWIPIEIWEARDLSWNEKVLLMEVDSFTSVGDPCYFSDEYIAELLGVGASRAGQLVSSLVNKGYLRRAGFDGRHRFIETTLAFQLILEGSEADTQKITEQGRKKLRTCPAKNYDLINNINKENNKREISNIRFTPPTIEEVRAYCLSRANGINPESFIDYYTANGWKVGRNPMRDWRAAVRQWEQRRKEETPNPRPAERRYLSPEERTLRALAQLQARDGQLNTFAPDEQ